MTDTATHPGTGGNADPDRYPNFEINIEGHTYDWDQPTITVPQIRGLGGLPTDQPVIEINFRDNTERTLPEDEVVTIKPGHGFGKKIGFKRGDR